MYKKLNVIFKFITSNLLAMSMRIAFLLQSLVRLKKSVRKNVGYKNL